MRKRLLKMFALVKISFFSLIITFFFCNFAFSKDIELILVISPHPSPEEVNIILNKIAILTDDGVQYSLLDTKESLILSRTFKPILIKKSIPQKKINKLIFSLSYLFKQEEISLSFPTVKMENKDKIFINLKLKFDNKKEKVILYFSDTREQYVKENLIFVLLEKGIIQILDKTEGTVVDFLILDEQISDIKISYKYNKVYILGNSKLYIYDLMTQNLESILLKRGIDPISLSITLLENNKEIGYIAYFKSNIISIVDLDNNYEENTLQAGNGPIKIWVDPPPSFVKRANEDILNYLQKYRQLYVLNYYSDTLLVYQIDALKGNIVNYKEFKTGSHPINLVTNYNNGMIFIINEGSTFLNIGYIPTLLSSSFNFLKLEGAGFNLVVGDYDIETDRLFLLRKNPFEILIAKNPFSGLSYSNKLFIIEELKFKNFPNYIKFDPELKNLYIIFEKPSILQIYNVLNRKTSYEIPLLERGKLLEFSGRY